MGIGGEKIGRRMCPTKASELLRYCLQSGRSLSCPPTSHTVKATFLHSTFSTLKPAEATIVTPQHAQRPLRARDLCARIDVDGCRNVPIVGTVDRTSPTCSRYRIVVLPAASSPSITTCIGTWGQEPKKENN